MTELRCAIALAAGRGRIRSARQLATAAGVSRHRVPAALRAIAAWGLGLALAPCSNSDQPPCSNSDQPPCSNSEPPQSRTTRGRARAQNPEREEREESISISSPLSADTEALRLTCAHLASWLEKHGQGVELTPPYPPAELAHDLLVITGTLPRLLDILEQLAAERRKPGYSWGWFVVAVRSRILGHRRTRPAAPLSDDRQPGLWSTPDPEIDAQSAPNAPPGPDPRAAAPRHADPHPRPEGGSHTESEGGRTAAPRFDTAELVDQLAQKRRMPCS